MKSTPHSSMSTFKCILLLTLTLSLCHRVIEGKASLPYSNKIDPPLLQILQSDTTANVVVVFNKGTSEVLEAISDIRFPTRDDLLIALNNALEQNLQETQANVIEFLDQFRGITYEKLWITNELFVHDADITLITALIEFDEVISVTYDREASLSVMEPNPSDVFYGRQDNSSMFWGIPKIQAPEANIFLKNLADSGEITVSRIRVATIDTGVRHTHEALRDNFLGEFGWYDPHEKTPIPYDNVGHGTHVTGTICGKNGIGVYPDATWMTCKGCRTLSCRYSDLMACGQWVTCPTTPDGLTKDCTKAPHVVSNSWSALRGNYLFDPMINAFHTAQIIPVFSIGNDKDCDTAKSPGDRNVIGVGSTSQHDAISFFSSKGPSADLRVKPDIVAPGSVVYSSYHTADDAYAPLSGTSMACPHTSGLITMLKAYDPEIPFNDILPLLSEGAETEGLLWDGTVCEPGDVGDMFPNHIFGYGRINALRTLQILDEISNKGAKC